MTCDAMTVDVNGIHGLRENEYPQHNGHMTTVKK